MSTDLHPVFETFLASLPTGGREAMAQGARQKRLAAGDRLFAAGDEAERIYLVLEGRLAVHKGSGFGERTQVVALLSAGALVGEAAILPDRTRRATVQALEESLVAGVDTRVLVALEEEEPQFVIALLQKLMSVISLRLEKSSERLALVL